MKPAVKKTVRLSPQQSIFCDREIVHFNLGNRSYLSIFDPGRRAGALLTLDSSSASARNKKIDLALKELNATAAITDFVFKAVGSSEVLEELNQILIAKGAGLSGRCLVPNQGGEAIFYCDTGRLRVRLDVPNRKRRVLIVDDSKAIRSLLREVLSADPAIEVVGDTGSPQEVEALVLELKPDVLTLDIHMPQMDGITLLLRLNEKNSVPAVMVSSVNQEEAYQVLRALELGAVDYIEKPILSELSQVAPIIREKVLAASQIVLPSQKRPTLPRLAGVGDPTKLPPIVLGASTGGPEALKRVLTRLPEKIPPILVAQHIPGEFSAAFAGRLNELCAFPVREARDGDPWVPGEALLAPGGKLTRVILEDGKMVIRVEERSTPDGYAPSIDLLFDSVATACGSFVVAALLTGMGTDGANGLAAIKRAGGFTVAQDEESCIVFGMPRAAIQLGAANEVAAIDAIASLLYSNFRARSAA